MKGINSFGENVGRLWKGTEADISSQGQGVSPVICSHGYLDNAATFDKLLPLLMTPKMTFLSIDFPGHGFSSPWPGTYYDLLMNGLISFVKIMEYYKWPKVSLMGHSLGAQASFLFAAAFPE